MKTKITVLSVLAVVLMTSVFAFVGFGVQSDPIKVTTNRGTDNTPKSVSGPALLSPQTTINESFEGTFPPAGWTNLTTGGSLMWSKQAVGTTPLPGWTGAGSLTAPPGGTGGTATAYVTYDDAVSNNAEFLITPQITNVQPGDSLKFWLRYIVPAYDDSFRVKVSTTTNAISAFTTTMYSKKYSGAVDTGWVQLKFAMGSTVPAGSNIYIAFNEGINDNINEGSAIQMDLVSYTPAAAPPPPSQWFTQTTGVAYQLASISAPSNDVCWVSGGTDPACKVLRTTNGGTWADASGNLPATTGAGYVIWGIDANTAVVATSLTTGNTWIYRTTNAGTTWTQVLSQTTGFMDGFYFKDANTGICYGDPVGGRWAIFKTTNGGANWDSTGMYLPQVGTEAGWNNSMCGVGDRVWFGTNNTKIYYSTNFGTSWTPQVSTGQLNVYSIWFNNATTGLAGYTGLLTTSNSGTLWTAGTAPGTAAMGGLTGTASTFWMVRQAAIVYKTTDNGATWGTDFTGTGTLQHIGISRTGNSGGNVWACTAAGVIYKYGVSTGVVEPISNVATDYKLNQNYPNPFNPTTKITFAVPVSGLVTLKIYDMLGKEVASLVNGQMNSGSYSVDFNAATLSSGIYFYSLQSGNFVDTKKMMLVK